MHASTKVEQPHIAQGAEGHEKQKQQSRTPKSIAALTRNGNAADAAAAANDDDDDDDAAAAAAVAGARDRSLDEVDDAMIVQEGTVTVPQQLNTNNPHTKLRGAGPSTRASRVKRDGSSNDCRRHVPISCEPWFLHHIPPGAHWHPNTWLFPSKNSQGHRPPLYWPRIGRRTEPRN
jgi:hypothetical protein